MRWASIPMYRAWGGKLKAKHEIRVATLFRNLPEEFLRMIVVHELAHLKEKEHNKAFYGLCQRMEPQYHQYEFDLRLYPGAPGCDPAGAVGAGGLKAPPATAGARNEAKMKRE